MYGHYGYPSYGGFYEGGYPEFGYLENPFYGDDELVGIIEEIAVGFVARHVPISPPRPSAPVFQPQTFVGWSPPPHPVDVVVSFNPHASKKEKAAAVLLDYYHDNALRSWADDGNVKQCFIGGSSPKKEDHDPLLLVAAYENPHHKIWQCAGLRWKDLDDAVQGAIARRMKLGPLPKPSYDTNPIVIYYYDNDAMKRITYPLLSVPDALNPANASGARYWAMYSGPGDDASVDAGLDKVHTLQTADPRKIRIERENPGWKNKAALKKILAKYASEFQHSGDCPTCKGTLGMGSIQAGSAGGWDDEGFDWDRDVAGTGIVGSITGAILALVSAVLTATGVGAVVGVPLGIATPLIVAAINDLDIGLHTGDFGAGIAGLATAIAQAATSGAGQAGISLPPAAMKALASTVTSVAASVRAGEQKKLDFGQIWTDTAKQVQGMKFGDDEAIAIAKMLTGQGPAAGHVFIQGYLAGKFLDMKSIEAIAKLLKAMAVFADPRIINLGLLGMGFGHLARSQGRKTFSPTHPSSVTPKAYATHGEFLSGAENVDSVGQIFMSMNPHDDLAAFVHMHLKPRYGLSPDTYHEARHLVGLACPEGYDLVATDHPIACAYRKKAPCLAGFTDARGVFVCSDWDYPPCPSGMGHISGSPKNWCFSLGPQLPQTSIEHVGGDPDWSFPALGCQHGEWWDSLTQTCRPIVLPSLPPPPPPRPRPHGTGFGW